MTNRPNALASTTTTELEEWAVEDACTDLITLSLLAPGALTDPTLSFRLHLALQSTLLLLGEN